MVRTKQTLVKELPQLDDIIQITLEVPGSKAEAAAENKPTKRRYVKSGKKLKLVNECPQLDDTPHMMLEMPGSMPGSEIAAENKTTPKRSSNTRKGVTPKKRQAKPKKFLDDLDDSKGDEVKSETQKKPKPITKKIASLGSKRSPTPNPIGSEENSQIPPKKVSRLSNRLQNAMASVSPNGTNVKAPVEKRRPEFILLDREAVIQKKGLIWENGPPPTFQQSKPGGILREKINFEALGPNENVPIGDEPPLKKRKVRFDENPPHERSFFSLDLFKKHGKVGKVVRVSTTAKNPDGSIRRRQEHAELSSATSAAAQLDEMDGNNENAAPPDEQLHGIPLMDVEDVDGTSAETISDHASLKIKTSDHLFTYNEIMALHPVKNLSQLTYPMTDRSSPPSDGSDSDNSDDLQPPEKPTTSGQTIENYSDPELIENELPEINSPIPPRPPGTTRPLKENFIPSPADEGKLSDDVSTEGTITDHAS